jgi:hypothetical protein
VVPGVQDYEEAAYWRDVGTLSALAAAQQDAMGHRPRFNLWNRRWPIRGEYDAALMAKLRDWREAPEAEEVETETPSVAVLRRAAAARAANRARHRDERRQTS